MDVNLRMTAWTLRQRERKLAEMVDALRVRSVFLFPPRPS